MKLSKEQAEALAAQLNERLEKRTYEPCKAHAYLENDGISASSLYCEAFHDLELCVDFARVHGLNIYVSYSDLNHRVVVRLF